MPALGVSLELSRTDAAFTFLSDALFQPLVTTCALAVFERSWCLNTRRSPDN